MLTFIFLFLLFSLVVLGFELSAPHCQAGALSLDPLCLPEIHISNRSSESKFFLRFCSFVIIYMRLSKRKGIATFYFNPEKHSAVCSIEKKCFCKENLCSQAASFTWKYLIDYWHTCVLVPNSIVSENADLIKTILSKYI
jgi:hypothetical protein